MKKFVIIVAGGTGQRMLTDTPKQFLLLKQKPILFYSLQTFFTTIPGIEIIIVLPENYIDQWSQLCDIYKIDIPHKIVKGGKTRFESVKNGLNLLPEKGVVAIHDGARPLVSCDLIKEGFLNAEKYGNATPAIEMDESIRFVENDKNKIINRKKIRIIQTPQCFNLSLLKIAYRQEYDESFTDDSSVLEKTGINIYLFEGSRKNLKITYPDDLAISEILLSK